MWFFLAEEVGTGWGASVTGILLAIATLIGVVVQAIISLRAAKKVDVVEAKVNKSDLKIDGVLENVEEVAKHTNSMKDALILATAKVAQLEEKARGEEVARKLLSDSAEKIASALEAQSRGMLEGAAAEKLRQASKPDGGPQPQ